MAGEVGERRLAQAATGKAGERRPVPTATGEVGEGRLALAAIALSLAGLLVLFFYAQGLEPTHATIPAILSAGTEIEGSYLEVLGTVSSASSRTGNVFINLCDYQSCIAVFVSSSQADVLRINPYLLKKGDRLAVRGTLQFYKGEPELVTLGADGIELI
ncbi:OB-fold nucleic acid binding domain protein [Candidatus Burarchaeum australiense]|nr:OB-fold nucleic acid binding domain protein [Candidatus Burarchaeum australiense]